MQTKHAPAQLTVPVLVAFMLAVSSCAVLDRVPPEVTRIVRQTVVVTRIVVRIVTPTPETPVTPRAVEVATVRGKLCYPSEGIPPMTVYARSVRTQATYSTHVEAGADFEIELVAPDEYVLFAWTDAGVFTEESRGGVYSCIGMFTGQMGYLGKAGVDLTCHDPEDHTPLIVRVEPGASVETIYVCDFYSEDSVPRP